MELLTLSVILWFVAYTAGSILISRYYLTEDSGDSRGLSIWGPLLTIRSGAGIKIVHQIASVSRSVWGFWGKIGVFAAVVTAIGGIGLLVTSAYAILTRPDNAGIQGPTDMIVIPGVNRFLPVSVAPEILFGLLIAMVVHEAGHAIYCSLGNINIKSTGLIFAALIPIGAFVEPDEEEQNEADTVTQLKMYSAGIMNNYATFIISIVGVIALTTMLVSPVTGVAIGTVFPDSPAESSGLDSGDVITQVNGQDVQSIDELSNLSENQTVNTVTLNTDETVEMTDGLYVTQAPSQSSLSVAQTITEVDGSDVESPDQFKSYLSNVDSRTASVTYANGTTESITIGVYLTVQTEGSLSSSLNLQRGDSVIITSINELKVNSEADLRSQIQSQDNITVQYVRGGEIVSTDVSTSEIELDNYLYADQPSAIEVSPFGFDPYPKDGFYNALTVGDGVQSTLANIVTILYLPIASIIPTISFGFPGFSPFVENFYSVGVGGSITATAVFTTITVLFWSAWINFNLAVFNCIPTFALDGGHILKASVWDLPYDLSDRTERYLILGIKSVVLIPLVLLLLGPLVF